MTAPSHSSNRSEPHANADDPAARIAALFDAHCGFVCRVLRHHGVHEAALDDAVQDVFVTAYRRLGSFEGRSSARSWLFGIARRIAFRYRRSADARARRFVGSDDDAPEGVHEPFDRVQAAQSLAVLIDRLDADKRAVFVLAELEGMTAPEVAETLGLPLGTVYSRLRAAWQGLGREAGRETRRELSSLRAVEPSPEQRRRMWGLVAGGMLPSGGESGVLGASGAWLAQIKWMVVGAALGAGLLGARAAMVAASRPVAPPPAEARAESIEDRSTAGARSAGATPSAASRGTPSEAEIPIEPAAIAPTDDIEPRRPRSPPKPTSRTMVEPTTAEPATADGLTAELELLQRAQRALREDRPAQALEQLAEHARRFPEGQLADERRVVRLEALCAAGQADQAAREARALGRDPTTACP